MLRVFNSKVVGGTLLLAGTAMGGGLLALPLANAEAGFLNATFLMILCWGLMMASALITLEVSLWLPPGANIISMSQALLNPVITYIAWASYLLLFYSVTAAYIAAGSDFLSYAGQTYWPINYLQPIAAIVFTGLLGSIVYQGIHWVEYLNRHFMIIKLALYSALVMILLPHSKATYWTEGDARSILHGFSVAITSFSYANIIPSLRSYFKEDIKSLRQSILIGGTIPLICYILWNMSVMGIITLSGDNGLISISQSSFPVSYLMNILNQMLHHSSLKILSHSFSCVCILTTFLTCSFGLSDFLADGFGFSKHTSTKRDILIYGATFIPPLLIALCFPQIFIKALHYAGIYCLILFVLIPAMLAWRGRYALKYSSRYVFPGGKTLLISLGIGAIAGILHSLYQLFA